MGNIVSYVEGSLGSETLEGARRLERIRVDRGVEEGTDTGLGVGEFRADIVGGIPVGLGDTDDVDVGVVSRLEEVLSLEVLRTHGVHGSPVGADLAIGEEFRCRESRLLVGLLRRRRATLETLDGCSVAADTAGHLDVGTLVGKGGHRTRATKLLRLVEHDGFARRIGSEKDVQDYNTGCHGAEANHLRLGKLHHL